MINHSVNDISEIEFRIWFRKEFGIDYLEAVEKLNQRKKESERNWQNMLIKNGII